MELILIFLNPKKCFQGVKDGKFLKSLVPFYLALFLFLIFYLNKLIENKRVFYGATTQIIFNIVFIIFISLFIKVFIKMFGIDRKFILCLIDTLLIFIPSFVLFIIMVIFFYPTLNKMMYGLIYLFSYYKEDTFNKTLFFFYYPPRILLFLYTFLGIRFIYNLSIKRSLLVTSLIYFIIFIVYLF
ncbi:MAG: hypothetical protein N3D74_01425 [Caldisericia bacterium]|nr:hypothetical protein [Caldisericia bacterium]